MLPYRLRTRRITLKGMAMISLDLSSTLNQVQGLPQTWAGGQAIEDLSQVRLAWTVATVARG